MSARAKYVQLSVYLKDQEAVDRWTVVKAHFDRSSDSDTLGHLIDRAFWDIKDGKSNRLQTATLVRLTWMVIYILWAIARKLGVSVEGVVYVDADAKRFVDQFLQKNGQNGQDHTAVK